jgi:hypothetical protein
MGAGAAGAIGALGIIMAFTFGGKPIFVMPLVFGCAPIVNTFTTMLAQGTLDQIELPFVGSLGLVITGAVMVLVFAPKAGHHPPAKSPPAEAGGKPGATGKGGKGHGDGRGPAQSAPDAQADNRSEDAQADRAEA